MSNPRLDIIIHPNAVVALSSHIYIETTTDLLHPESSSPSSQSSQSPPVTIKLIIAGGNLFHPQSRLILIPPESQNNNTTTIQTNDEQQGGLVVVRIGENNVFEEECTILLDLRTMNQSSPSPSSEDEESVVTTIIESYNQFAPRSSVRSTHIGNANIFQPLCRLTIPTIKNGNIFGSTLQITIGSGATANDLVFVDDDEPTNDAGASFFQEKVLYMVRADKQQPDVNRHVVRPHVHGMKRNMRVVGLILGATRTLVRKNHRLMAETTPAVSS
eukprot:CAMPEP_0198278038 /NCGR_PEP_ID=MMETSP1447-20131203/66172_1 /TAXON_ID=420782 /ORGANISM="Chaetoceros dichaeta, Strain CCMP1751" /LENGTH=272 /DNA_ID=CAMNT_0043973103 /DNA_START=37 /DNA_END=855 /DNA_ORIENTATION=-